MNARRPFGDVRDVIASLEHFDGEGYALMDLYPVRERVLRESGLEPHSFFEFGAFKGYAIVAALHACPTLQRIGWVDNESYFPGSNAPAAANVREYARRYRDDRQPELWVASHSYQAPGFGKADVVYVDADHSFAGCLGDLLWAVMLDPELVFLDDWTAHSAVADAGRFFVEHSFQLGWPCTLTEHETVNGLAVLRRR